MNNARKLNILLVEDDDVAAEAVLRGLRRHAENCQVTIAEDGFTALQILRGQHETRRIGKPHLVMLDLNMPRMNGLEFLKEVRADADLRGTVVFILTTSDIECDRVRAYEEGVAGYIVKAACGPQCSRLAQFVEDYHEVVRLPD
ncbi:MAG TPA: response regulator [Steroidobacteraceae bacterium]